MRKSSAFGGSIVAITLALAMMFSNTALAAGGSWTETPGVSLSASTHVIANPHLVFFTGRITASHSECKSVRPVALFTGANGVGFVGSTVSSSSGQFAIPAFVDRNHTYRAIVTGQTTTVHPDTQVCNDANSANWIVRVQNKG